MPQCQFLHLSFPSMSKVPREASEQVMSLQALILYPAAASQLPDLVELVFFSVINDFLPKINKP